MQQRSILVVEDDVVLCTAMGAALMQRGYDTRMAHSVSDGINQARERLPELIILDISLPDGLGWKVLDDIRDAYPDKDISVIVTTSERISRSQRRAYQVQRFFTKPLDFSHLLETVAELLPLSDTCRQEAGPVR